MAALVKQSVPINFAEGLDLKTDPFQLRPGKFLSLQNSIFEKGGLLQKRNGYGQLTPLPDSTSKHLTTFNGGLTAIGSTLFDYSEGSATWIDKGPFQPVALNTQSVIRSATNQTQSDSVIASNGIMCVVYTDVDAGTPTYKYAVTDSTTGQMLVPPTLIPVSVGAVAGSPRVFNLGKYFVMVLTVNISGTYHLQYVTINTNNPTLVSTSVNISSQYTPAATVAFDGVVYNNNLYLAWNGSDGGGAIRLIYITSTLSPSTVKVFTGKVATIMSTTFDLTGNRAILYASFYDSGSSNGFTLAVDAALNTVFAPVATITGETVLNIVSAAQNSSDTIFYEVAHNYSYDSAIPTHFIKKNTISSTGTVGSATILVRSVGLASKAFIYAGTAYFLAVYFSAFQPTNFLLDQNGKVISKLAYSNARGYYTTGLPNANLINSTISISYLYKDLLAAVNKSQGAPNAAGVYSQTGVNVAYFNLSPDSLSTAEIAGGLHLSGGFMWFYDGVTPVEDLFHLWPDNVEVTAQSAAGNMTTQQYFYVATYEWTDAAGNIQRSAPSVPVSITLSGGENQATVFVPTLRLTYKVASPVKIVIYRWSVAQQTYYQVTSITSPLLNDVTIDSVSFVDTQADSAIIGNSILYTTGGVIENIAAPATSNIALFKSRLFLIDSEDQNLLWYSKQVIENTPVEMSDLFTIYIAPTISAQGNTGPLKVLAAMDDKLILFKKDAIYYITGNGPDNTGTNNDFSDPVFITSTVGSANANSVVFTPVGLMFESDKGIWLLGRDLSTNYIGAPVENFNNNVVKSALAIPGTNQVRFTLDNNTTLMYDYYFGQWSTFINIPAISSTLFQDLHTYINNLGQVLQETPGVYLDGTNPVLLSFTTSWFNLAGLQGFERAYFFYLLANYMSPHKLTVKIAYDYNPQPSQSTVISPDNFSGTYGTDSFYGGGSPYGGPPQLEQWRVFLQKQKCQSFQVSISESYDPSMGQAAGAGFTMSGLNLVVGTKKGYPKLASAKSVG